MSIHIGKTRIKLHGVLPLLWFFSVLSGTGQQLGITLLALCLHESGHLIAAKLLGIRVEQIEITPHGGLILLENMEYAPLLSSFLVASAGPFFSLAGFLAAWHLFRYQIFSPAFSFSFAKANLLLLLVNLSPALPLDGGRMARALLCYFCPWQKATKILLWAGYAIGALFVSISLYFAFQGDLILSPAFIGCYFIYSSAREGKNAAAHYITALIARRKKIDEQQFLSVQWLAASENTKLLSLLKHLQPGKYHAIIALSPDGLSQRGILFENQLCDCICTYDPEKTLSDCLSVNTKAK